MYAADYSIVITTPEPTALMDAYGLIKVASLNKKGIQLKLIVNIVNSQEEAKEISSRVILLSRRFLNVFVEPYGYIFRDKNVLNSVMLQKPFSVQYPDTKATQCIKQIAQKISLKIAKENVPESEVTQSAGNIFRKIFEVFNR
jgi:flagellar biosynthesis protein FlhG